jgi:hypothetical protein
MCRCTSRPWPRSRIVSARELRASGRPQGRRAIARVSCFTVRVRPVPSNSLRPPSHQQLHPSSSSGNDTQDLLETLVTRPRYADRRWRVCRHGGKSVAPAQARPDIHHHLRRSISNSKTARGLVSAHMQYPTDILLDEYPGPVDTTLSIRDQREVLKTLCCYLECPADRSKVRARFTAMMSLRFSMPLFIADAVQPEVLGFPPCVDAD